MKIKLTHDYRVSMPAGSVVDVTEQYAETLKALGVAEIVVASAKRKASQKKTVDESTAE